VRALLGTVLRKRRRRKEEAGKNPKKTL
jgi:peptide chain release factor subunit 3